MNHGTRGPDAGPDLGCHGLGDGHRMLIHGLGPMDRYPFSWRTNSVLCWLPCAENQMCGRIRWGEAHPGPENFIGLEAHWGRLEHEGRLHIRGFLIPECLATGGKEW